MLKKYSIPLFIAFICCLEITIYLWAVLTTEETQFIFAKCARNSGRASAALNLIIVLMAGHYGLIRIYAEEKKKDIFRILITLFAVNHLIHFFYILQNFKSTSKVLDLSENIHGILSFVVILGLPLILWSYKKLNKALYFGILLHLLNSTYFVIDTFYSKIIHDVKPTYLHRLGIVIMVMALLYMLYRFYCEKKLNPTENNG